MDVPFLDKINYSKLLQRSNFQGKNIKSLIIQCCMNEKLVSQICWGNFFLNVFFKKNKNKENEDGIKFYFEHNVDW
jgi:hypothetical protein